MSARKTIKRHESLQPLSRCHFVGLAQSQWLRQTASFPSATVLNIMKGFLTTWDDWMANHCDDEERLLSPHMTSVQARRMCREHARLRELICRLRRNHAVAQPDLEGCQTLGKLVYEHIRWEESSLFNAIQKKSPGGHLAELDEQTHLLESRRPRRQLLVNHPGKIRRIA